MFNLVKRYCIINFYFLLDSILSEIVFFFFKFVVAFCKWLCEISQKRKKEEKKQK